MPDCIFCKIIKKEIPSEVVFEDDDLVVFRDIEPKAKFHFLIVPKKHIESVNAIEEDETGLIGDMIYRAKLVAMENGFSESGYKLIFNCGRDGGQAVPHLHLHLLGGEPLGGLV